MAIEFYEKERHESGAKIIYCVFDGNPFGAITDLHGYYSFITDNALSYQAHDLRAIADKLEELEREA